MNLADSKTLRDLLERHGISAKKSLGQHFLCSATAVNAVLGKLEGIHGVLEIGPGPGVLTSPISERVKKIVAIEIDSAMISALAESSPNADILQLDALKTDLGEIASVLPEPRAVVSNLPYYITAPLLTSIARSRSSFAKAVLMMQKEVGARIMAPAGNRERGSLSVYLQCLFTIRKVVDVPRGAFMPPPNVDSVILEFTPKTTESPPEELFELVRQGFKQPRKTLVNNLADSYSKPVVEHHLVTLGLTPKTRPHEVRLEQWNKLYELLQ